MAGGAATILASAPVRTMEFGFDQTYDVLGRAVQCVGELEYRRHGWPLLA